MLKKNFIFLSILYLLNGCGFTPTFNASNININIKNVDYTNNKINRNFVKAIKTFSNQESNVIYNLQINSFSQKNVIAKDNKGNPSIYNLKLRVNVILANVNETKQKEKSFSENINFNDTDDKFKLKITEDNLLDQMSQKILRDILKFLVEVK